MTGMGSPGDGGPEGPLWRPRRAGGITPSEPEGPRPRSADVHGLESECPLRLPFCPPEVPQGPDDAHLHYSGYCPGDTLTDTPPNSQHAAPQAGGGDTQKSPAARRREESQGSEATAPCSHASACAPNGQAPWRCGRSPAGLRVSQLTHLSNICSKAENGRPEPIT